MINRGIMTNRRIVIAGALSVLADPLAGRKASAHGAMTKNYGLRLLISRARGRRNQALRL